MSPQTLQAYWSAEDSLRTFFDPQASGTGGVVEIVSNRPASGGVSVELGKDASIVLSLDDEEHVVHLSFHLSGCSQELTPPLRRPEQVRVANFAEVEVEPELEVECAFDATAGTVQVRFCGREQELWGRIGTSDIWLALDQDQRLAGMLIEGVVDDPGGGAQLAWLQASQ